MRQVSEEKQVIVHAPDPFVFKGIKKNPVYIKEKHVIDIVRGGPFDLWGGAWNNWLVQDFFCLTDQWCRQFF